MSNIFSLPLSKTASKATFKVHRISSEILHVDCTEVKNKKVVRIILRFSEDMLLIAKKRSWLFTTKKLKEFGLKKEGGKEISFILNNDTTNSHSTNQEQYLNNFFDLLKNKNLDINNIIGKELVFDVMYACGTHRFHFISGNNMDIK